MRKTRIIIPIVIILFILTAILITTISRETAEKNDSSEVSALMLSPSPENVFDSIQELDSIFNEEKSMMITIENQNGLSKSFICDNPKRYIMLLNNCEWALTKENFIPLEYPYSLSISSIEDNTFLRFFGDSECVLLCKNGMESYYTVKAPGSEYQVAYYLRRNAFDPFELDHWDKYVETDSDDLKTIAELYIKKYSDHLYNLFEGSIAGISDFIDIGIEITDKDNTEFVFSATYAIKPNVYDSPVWWAGGGDSAYPGEGDLEEYIIRNINIKLKHADNLWMMEEESCTCPLSVGK